MDGGAWWAAVHGVAKSRTRLSDFTFTFQFHALEKAMATHSSVLAWRIPGTVEPGGLPSMGSHRVRHNWNDLAAAYYNLILKSSYKDFILWYTNLFKFYLTLFKSVWAKGTLPEKYLQISAGILVFNRTLWEMLINTISNSTRSNINLFYRVDITMSNQYFANNL